MKQPVRTEERQTLVDLTGVRSALASGEPTSAFANTQDLLREGSIVNKVICRNRACMPHTTGSMVPLARSHV